MNGYVGIYGNVSIPKGWCGRCGALSFIVEDHLVCCNVEVIDVPTSSKRESNPLYVRKNLSAKQKVQQVESQGGKCFYCDRGFGSIVRRRNRWIVLKVNFDHLIPFAYTQNNKLENFVAACHICNQLKSCFVFDSIEDIRGYILGKWKEIGYVDMVDCDGSQKSKKDLSRGAIPLTDDNRPVARYKKPIIDKPEKRSCVNCVREFSCMYSPMVSHGKRNEYSYGHCLVSSVGVK